MKVNRVGLNREFLDETVKFVLIRQEGEKRYCAHLEWEEWPDAKSITGSPFENEIDRLALVQLVTRAEAMGIRSDQVREERREQAEIEQAKAKEIEGVREHLKDMREIAKALASKVGCGCRSYD